MTMFPPTADEILQAKAWGIDPTGLSGSEVRSRVATRRRIAAARRANLAEHKRLLAMCRAIGAKVPYRPSSSELEALLKQYLPSYLKECGIVEGVMITMPKGVVTQYGAARVGKLHVGTAQVPVITLYFESVGRGFTFNAFRVAMRATLLPSGWRQ